MMFGEKLRDLRESKGISQKGLADASGFTQAAISRWEAGEQVPALDSAQALCKALGVSCNVFDGCEYAAVESRGRGRPRKAESAPEPKPAKKKKGKGA